MALSEHEQRLLDDMERRLYQSEADVVHTAPGPRRSLNLRALVLGIVLGLVGVALLVTGVALQQLWIGLIGFALMLGGTVLAFSRPNAEPEESRGGTAHKPGPATGGPTRVSFGERMERRWDERLEGER